MHDLSIFGTASDVGKSTLTFVIARLLQERGISTVPFKAQNVSNNSQVADDGSEIAISTFFQASVLGVETSWHLNPVLLKSGGYNRTSLIVRGKEVGQKDVRSYYRDLDMLKPVVEEGFTFLSRRYDCVVAEGAGGCVELNLLEKDLSNTFIAECFDTKIILVADIEKGGVFAQIYGTLALMKEQFRKNLIGVVINKFRGDRTLFDDGVKIIEEKFGVPVLGVLPHIPLNLGFEDSASLQNYVQKRHAEIKVGVIKLPHISNFNDFEPLILDEEVQVDFIVSGLEQYDIVCLPGSKRVTEDLTWLKESGLFDALQSYEKQIVAICGGYEMLFEKIIDTEGVESNLKETEGIGKIEGEVFFSDTKVLQRSEFIFHEELLHGYEIHYARSQRYPIFYEKDNIFGTFLHGVFDNDAFRKRLFKRIKPTYQGYDFQRKRVEIIDTFVQKMGSELDMERIISCIRS
jgi:adenosylcobyric acid synthase